MKQLPTGSEIGNDYSKAKGIVCRIPFIFCDGVVTDCEDTKNNMIKTQYKLKVTDKWIGARYILISKANQMRKNKDPVKW